jgi:hypothetical protein
VYEHVGGWLSRCVDIRMAKRLDDKVGSRGRVNVELTLLIR